MFVTPHGEGIDKVANGGVDQDCEYVEDETRA